MNYEACINYILNIPLFGKKNDLNNIKELMKRLNSPDKQLNFIHVAGTNGKGSVCSMLSTILKEKGLKVGLFTSPHLVRINERVQINNVPISDDDFALCTNQIVEIIDDMVAEGLNHPTFFEVMFAIAILHFFKEKVDIVILETGLGGRLDATNIIQKPLVSIITKIGLDHTNILGDTISKIASEKGGIIKNGCPVVVYDKDYDILSEIQRISIEKNANLHEVHPFSYNIIKRTDKTIDFSINSKYYNYDRLRMTTTALYQIDNLAIALTALAVADIIVPDEVVFSAVQKFYWPGRMELVNDYLLIDGAHNENGIETFLNNLVTVVNGKRTHLLFAAMNDKNYVTMIDKLCAFPFDKITLTQVHKPRGLDPKVLQNEFDKRGRANTQIETDIEKVLLEAKNDNGTLLCCVGSLYLVGEIKRILGGGVYD